MLDLRRLRLLSELARRGTIAEVGRAVGYSASAVSQSLSQLEREVGMALLERDGRNVRLTPAAHRLVARTDRVLAELDAAEAELAAEQGAVRGELVIGAFPSAGARLVAPAVGELAARHPELTCSVREHEPEDGIPLLRSGALDLLISESYEDVTAAPVGGLEQRVLLSEPLLLALPAAARPSPAPDGHVPLADLAGAPWISGIAGTQFVGAVEQACRAAGFVPRIAHRADDATLILGLVAAGIGVGLVPELACVEHAGVAYARAVPEPPLRHISALLRRGAAQRPALAALLEALLSRRITGT
ncbi:LysR family transcriptional regulator [Solirubrobacter soli]|uniref:LysR family transcriptional regulator n=1 Tax=Solirubrobacter soli TaxID=363832 RepID=UPI000412D410|nr:LysR family transcriptional regulator [Solirubrobacter soli]